MSTPDPFGDALETQAQGAPSANDDAFGSALSIRASGGLNAPPKSPVDGTLSRERTSGPVGFINGLGEIIGKGIGNIPMGAVHGAYDLASRALGHGAQPSEPTFPLSPNAQSVGQGIGDAVSAAVEPYRVRGAEPFLNNYVAPVLGDVGAIAPVVGAGEALAGAASVKATGPLASAAQDIVDKAYPNRSMGAASAAPNVTTANPKLQQAIIDTAKRTGGSVNKDVLERRIEADSLPVPMDLTEGQATQDPVVISHEQNLRGKQPELAQHFNTQNTQLVDNARAIREAAGPDVFSTGQLEHGDALIQAYKAKGEAADADTSAKYQALKDANGGQFPVDAKALLADASTQLHQGLLYDHAPKAVMSTLGRLADQGNMSFENFESLRTNLSRIQRSSTDGNERAAAGVIRNSMEALPLAPGAADLKPLADSARAAAKAQFDALRADPAYKAAVNDEVPPDRFVQKFITGPTATRDSVGQMAQNLAHDDRATQTISVAAIDHLRKQAGIDELGNGNVSQANLNKHWQAIRPKVKGVMPPEQVAQLDALGNVARYTQAQPRGSFVNNSGTLVGALALHGANVLEGVGNVKAGGLPLGTYARGMYEKRAGRKLVDRALDPASGLERP